MRLPYRTFGVAVLNRKPEGPQKVVPSDPPVRACATVVCREVRPVRDVKDNGHRGAKAVTRLSAAVMLTMPVS